MENINKQDVISIIIPTYNRNTQLKWAANSILTQKIPNVIIEVVIIDDGSTDGTRFDTVEKFIGQINENNVVQKKYKLIYLNVQEGPKGPSFARNTGMLHCNGDYIVFLDSDDQFYNENSLNALYQEIKKQEEKLGPMLVYGNALMHQNEAGSLWEPKHLFYTPNFCVEKLWNSEGLIPMGAFIFSREIAKMNQILEDMGIGEDFEWQLRVSSKYPFHHLDEIVLNYYRSQSGQLSTKEHTQEERRKNTEIIINTKKKLLQTDRESLYRQNNLTVYPRFPYDPDESFSQRLIGTINGRIAQIDQSKLIAYQNVDLYFYDQLTGKHEILSHKDTPNFKVLWLIDEPRINIEFISMIQEYPIIITFNCALTETLKGKLGHNAVHTIPLPYDLYLFPYEIKSKTKIKKDVLLLQNNPALIDDLEDSGITYSVFDGSDNIKVEEHRILVDTRGRYFDPTILMFTATEDRPLMTTARKGSGFTPHAVVDFVSIIDIVDRLKEMIEGRRIISPEDMAKNARAWLSGNPEFTTELMLEKFSSTILKYSFTEDLQ